MGEFKKTFDHDLYDENDGRAKDKVAEIYHKLPGAAGTFLINNPLSLFAADCLVLKPIKGTTQFDTVSSLEVEVKVSWHTHKYTFNTVRIAARKRKLQSANFLMFNRHMTAALYIPSEIVHSAPITFEPNRLSKGNDEAFITIDPAKCLWIEIKPPPPKRNITDYGF